MSMRYPADATGGDFVTFRHAPYRSNTSGGASFGGGGGIILYMPEDTPAIQNGNKWQSYDFQGPFNKFRLDTVSGSVGRVSDVINSGGSGAMGAARGIVNDIKDSFKRNGGGKAIAEQGALGLLAKAGGLPSASHLLAVSRGEIYNPNVEMIYEGPTLRDYSFTFMFIPKDETDAQAAASIVKEFKTWSAPTLRGQKLGLPHVWQISYGGKAGEYMNKFKQAALRDVAVDYNSGLPMHMTFPSGMPITTTLQLSFTECQFVFREDHQQTRMGY